MSREAKNEAVGSICHLPVPLPSYKNGKTTI